MIPTLENGRSTLATAVTMTLVLAAAAGCDGSDSPISPTGGTVADPGPISQNGNVTASLRAGPHQNGEQTVTVEIEGEDLPVAAYQGAVRFDASGLELVEASVPEAGEGKFFVFNDRGAPEGGIVRFAAYAVRGFDSPEAIRLHFRSERPLRTGDLELALDVVGTPEGVRVPATRISTSPAVR